MPSVLSLCLALLRIAIRTTNRVQGLLINLHNTIEWVIEQQGDPLQIRSSAGQSTTLTLPPNADTAPSGHVSSPNLLAISTAEDNSSISMLESLRSQIFPATREVPISSTSKRVGVQSTGSKNNSGESSHPPLLEDEAKIQEIELTLKLFNKEPMIEPIVTVSSKPAYGKHDSVDHASAATSGITRQSNEQSAVLQSISKSGTDAEDSHILKDDEFKWREYRMMLKWYRDGPVVSAPDGGLDENELKPLDLSTNSEILDDTIDPEEANKPHSDLLTNVLETTKELVEDGILSLSESTPCQVIPEVSSAPTSSKKSTRSTSTDRNVQGSIPKSPTSQASAESSKSKNDSKHKRGKSNKEKQRHSSESAYLSKTSAPSGELETDVASEVKALPESLTREPWMVTDKASYNLDLKFERNLLLKEYDISTIKEKGTSRTPKSPIRDYLTKNKHDIESNKKTPSQVRHSPSDRKKSDRTPVKSNESSVSPSAVALPQSLSLPRFCVDSSTGNVQWKSNIPTSDFSSESKQRSPFKQSNKSPKKTNLEIGIISEASIKNLQISAKKMESDKTTKVSESSSESLPSETSTTEEDFQFKPTRERRPTPPPAGFPEVETSTDSEKVDSKVKSLFCTEPIKISSVESEFKFTRERRPTPAARFPTNEFSANKDESDEESKLAISLPVEALKLKGKSPLKSQQKRIPTTEVGYTVQSSPRRKNAVYDRPERFSPSLNQSIGKAERAEFISRERRPAVRFPTPDSTDNETVGNTPTQHALQAGITEAFTKNEAEPDLTDERMSSSVPEITITRSPTCREEEVSVKSKLASRLVRKSSTSPRNSGKSRAEDKTSPTVRFQIPDSQAKRENTGTTRKEYKLALRKTAKELSTSEEEYDSKHSLSTVRKGSPAKYPFFKSPRMLEDAAAAAARSLNFSPRELPIEIEVETRPQCQGNTFADEVPILEKSAKNEHPYSDSSSGGSLRTVLLDRMNITDEGVLIHGSANAERHPYEESYSTTFEGDSAPEGAACAGPRLAIMAPHNSPINFKVTDEPSTEMSQSESTTGSSSSDEEDSAIEAVSERPSAKDIRSLRRAGFGIHLDSNSSDSRTNETSIGYGSGGDSAPEGTAGLFPQHIPEPLNIAENVDSSRKNSTASTDGSRRDSVPEARVCIYGNDFTLSECSTEISANMSGEDSSPEGTAGLSSQFVGIESPSESTCSATEKGASVCLLPGNSRSVTDSEKVDSNARLDFTLSESSTVVVSSHASEEDSAPEGTAELFPEPSNTESPVNAEINKVELSAENDFVLTESTSRTSTGDGFSRGNLAFENTSPLKSQSESSSKTRAEKGTSLETDSTSLESLKYEGAGGDSDPESTEKPFLQTSTAEFPTNADNTKDTSSEIDLVSSNAKLSETSTSNTHGGDEMAHEEATDLYKQEISKSSNSDERSKEPGAKNYSTAETTKSKRILKTSSGDYEPKEASDPSSQPEKKEFLTNFEDSDDTSSETDSTSSESTANEKSFSDGPGDDSATGGAPNLHQEPETSKYPSNTGEESKYELNTGADSSSSGFTAGDTSTDKRLEGDSALEETTNNCPLVESGNSPTDSRNASSTGTDSTASDFLQSRTSRNEGATGGSVLEEPIGHNLHIETLNSSSANDTNGVRSEYGQAYAVELPSADAESNSPDRLSTIHEVSTNGTISDANYSVVENGYLSSSSSELSNEDAGKFILEQDSDNHSELCKTPTNGDISSQYEETFRQEPVGNEYLHEVESSEEICEWPANEKETGKTSDSDTISSLSSASKSTNSEEESEHARIKIENTSEPNSDKSETCNVPILSLNTETKNIDEDRNVKVQSVYLQENEYLEMSDCEADVASLLDETVQRISEGNLQETVSQTPSQILATDFNSNSVAASCSLSNTQEKTSCDVSVDSNNTDKTEVIQVSKTQDFISKASAFMKIETKVVSEKELTTESGDTSVSRREICSSILAPRDTFSLDVSVAEMESSNSVGDLQVEICSVKEYVTEKVIKTSLVFFQDASSECEEACENNTITEELTSPLLASYINIPDSEMANTAENNIAEVATRETYNVSKDTNEVELVKCSNALISESIPKNVPSNVEQAEIYDCSNYQSVACEVPHIADITETDIYVASEFLISEEVPLGSFPKLDASPELERTSPTLNIQAFPSIEQVDTKNGSKRLQWYVGKKLIKLDSAKNDVAEVFTPPFIYEANAKSVKPNEDLNSSLLSGTLVDQPHNNADYSKATDSASLGSTVPDTSGKVFSMAQKGSSNDPISNLINTLADRKVGDSSEKSESIIYKYSTDVHDTTADSSDSRKTLKSESPVCSTIARSEETGNNLDPEEIIDSGENFSELKESILPHLAIPNTRSASDNEISKNEDFVSPCDSSNDCAEHSKPENYTEFEVYIAPVPVTCGIAFGSAIEVLDSLPDTDYIEKIQDSTLSATELDSCEKPFTKQDGQDFKNNCRSQSVSCDTPNAAADIAKESSIAKYPFASMESSNPATADVVSESSISEFSAASDSDEPTSAEESTTSLQIGVLVLNVSETLLCGVSKNGHIESDGVIAESTGPTSSLEVSRSLDSARGTDKMPEVNEEGSGENVEKKAWKKNPRKSKKKRKH